MLKDPANDDSNPKEVTRRLVGRLVLTELVAHHLLRALSRDFSRKLILTTVDQGRSIEDLSVEQGIPLSSCYREARELVNQGILTIEQIIDSGSGRRYAVYRSSFKNIEMAFGAGGLSASVELNEAVKEKFRQKFIYSLPEGRQDTPKSPG